MNEYTSYGSVRGQTSKFEAGIIYKNVKDGNIVCEKVFISYLYKRVDDYIRYAAERYNQMPWFYDGIEDVVISLQTSDFEKAQEKINAIEKKVNEVMK